MQFKPSWITLIGIAFLFLPNAMYGQCPSDVSIPSGCPTAVDIQLDAQNLPPGNAICANPSDGGCATFTFNNIPQSSDPLCPAEICFIPSQGCGIAQGVICIYANDGLGGCIYLTTGGDGLVTCIIVNVTTFSITLCRPGNGPVSMNAISVGPCCEFEATCPNATNLGTFDYKTVNTIPAFPTTQAQAAAPPYNITFGPDPCGTILVSASDDIVPNACAGSNQTVTRTVFTWDDLPGGTPGVFDPGIESSQTCQYTYTVNGGVPAQLASQNPCFTCNFSGIFFGFCQGDPTPNLETLLQSNQNYETGASLNWYADNNGSQGSAISTPAVNTASDNTNYYWVSQRFGTCEGLAQRVLVVVNPPQSVTLSGGGVICGPPNPVPTVIATFSGTGPWAVTWTDGTNTYTQSQPPVGSNPWLIPNSGSVPGTYQILGVNDVNGCATLVNYPGSNSVTVFADGPPTAICQGTTVQLDGGGSASLAASSIDNGSSDDCSSVSLAVSPGSFGCADIGIQVVTLTVTDGAGNTAQCTANVQVDGHIPSQLAPQNCGNCSQIRFDFCEGDPTPDLEALLITNANYEPGATFNWYADNSGVQGGPISTPTILTNRNKRRFYWVSQQVGGCEGPARRVRVRVRKTSQVVLDLPGLGCDGAAINLAAWVSDSRGIANGFQFWDTDPGQGNPTPLGSVTATNGQVHHGQSLIINLSVGLQTYYATALNNTGCQVTGSDQLSAGAKPTLDFIADVSVSAGDAVNIPFSSPNATHIFWVDHSSFNNPDIGIIGAQGLGNLMFTAQNPTSAPLTATIRAIPYLNNCAGTYQDFTITVSPGPLTRQAQQFLHVSAAALPGLETQLSWDIRYDFELSHFEVERLDENEAWQKVGEVGWVQGQEHFEFTEKLKKPIAATYRLKLVHADGRFVWSKEVTVSLENRGVGTQFTISPNPTAGRFNISAEGVIEGNWHFVLCDPLGRTLLSGVLEGQKTMVNISHLPAAYYYLILTDETSRHLTKKIIRQ